MTAQNEFDPPITLLGRAALYGLFVVRLLQRPISIPENS